jgi:hypothetical protein
MLAQNVEIIAVIETVHPCPAESQTNAGANIAENFMQ